MHVTDWAEVQHEDPEIKGAMDWHHCNKKKSQPWTEQLAKLKSRLGVKKNTPEGRSVLWNADKFTLSGGLLYYRYKPKYQVKEVKCFIVPKAHRRTAMVATVMQATKVKREQRVSSLIDSGGQESWRMSTEQSRTVDDAGFMEGGKKGPQWSQ